MSKKRTVPVMSGHSSPPASINQGSIKTTVQFSKNDFNQANAMNKDSSHLSSIDRPCKEHTFLTDVADVKRMERELLQLLDHFHSGRLQAFGPDCSLEKLDAVREQQEDLARHHFEFDKQVGEAGLEDEKGRETYEKNMMKLIGELKQLSSSVQNLQPANPPYDTVSSPSN